MFLPQPEREERPSGLKQYLYASLQVSLENRMFAPNRKTNKGSFIAEYCLATLIAGFGQIHRLPVGAIGKIFRP